MRRRRRERGAAGRRRLSGEGERQVRHGDDRRGAQARGDGRLQRGGLRPGARRPARRRAPVPRLVRLQDAPVGARAGCAGGGRRRRDQLRAAGLRASRPHPRYLLVHQGRRLRQALRDRPDRRAGQAVRRRRHAVGPAAAHHRPRARARGSRAARGGEGQGRVRRGPQGASRVCGQDDHGDVRLRREPLRAQSRRPPLAVLRRPRVPDAREVLGAWLRDEPVERAALAAGHRRDRPHHRSGVEAGVLQALP